MSRDTADVVICGAGIAGVAAAYHLACQRGVRKVLLAEEREPLSLTSDKSTECYRNFWPGPGDGMVRLMNRSLDWLERVADESGDAFHLNRRGYLYCTRQAERLAALQRAAEESSGLGAGPLRVHVGLSNAPEYAPSNPSGFHDAPTGFDLLDSRLLQQHFPYLAPDLIGALHVRRAGWFSAQQLGRWLLDQARGHGARCVTGRVEAVDFQGGRVKAVRVQTASGAREVATPTFVNAAGPFVARLGRMLGADLAVYSELHAKVSYGDAQAVMPRSAPLLVLSDPQSLSWTSEERQALREATGGTSLLEELPSGLHARPEGPADSPILIGLWPYHTPVMEPAFPLSFDALYPEVVLRGLVALLPRARVYQERMPRPYVDGGFYTRTVENRPLIGPLPVEGSFVIGALSGFGLMAALGAGELLAAHVAGAALPEYASWFVPGRYDDPEYSRLLERWGGEAQL